MFPERFAPVLDELRLLASRFTAAGHRLYLVGGTVRDLMLDRPIKGDYDATTDARPDQIKKLLSGWADAIWSQGERFGTIGAKKGERTYEITTHRGETYTPESRKPDVEFADVIDADLSRRDFTVNAMAIEIGDDPVLVDPHGGLEDLLVHRRLRTPQAPELSFADDPLRMMRAARFIARFGLEPDPDLVAAVEAMRGRMEIVSAERVRDEWMKTMKAKRPSRAFEVMRATGLLAETMPEMLPSVGFIQNEFHTEDVFEHTLSVISRAAPERLVRLAALFHDLGKPASFSVGDDGRTRIRGCCGRAVDVRGWSLTTPARSVSKGSEIREEMQKPLRVL